MSKTCCYMAKCYFWSLNMTLTFKEGIPVMQATLCLLKVIINVIYLKMMHDTFTVKTRSYMAQYWILTFKADLDLWGWKTDKEFTCHMMVDICGRVFINQSINGKVTTETRIIMIFNDLICPSTCKCVLDLWEKCYTRHIMKVDIYARVFQNS